VVQKLGDAVPNLVAWKDGQGDTRRYSRSCRSWRPSVLDRRGRRRHVPRTIRSNPDVYVEHRTVSPKLSIELHEVAARGDAKALKQLMDEFVTPL